MPSAATIQPSSTDRATLDLHIIGGSKGESILVRLPDGAWGVVDCYASTPDDPSTNPTAVFLRNNGVERLDFLCLTHPHDDHFLGMAKLIDEFRPKEFWRFGALSHEHIKKYLAYLHIKAKATKNTELERSSKALMAIFERARNGARNGTIRIRRATARMNLSFGESSVPRAVAIECLAPTGNQIELYESAILNCVGADGRVATQLPHSRHNRVSMVLRITHGAAQIILGGDLEDSGWKDVLAEFGGAPLFASVVKVSHHGSTNGYCEHLWEHFSGGRAPIAVITPYHRFELPRPDAIKHISRYAQAIYTTCVPRSEPAQASTKHRAPVESRLALRETFGARTAPVESGAGRCTVRIDRDGRCTVEVGSPAMKLEAVTTG
jgi:beta-lactamase superfamily II metal-dependent hydrolase